MKLYLMQHGRARSEEEDPERELNDEGREEIQASAKAILKLELCFQVMVASTKHRSWQTAETVARAIGHPPGDIVRSDCLNPSVSAGEAMDFLAQFSGRDSVFVAGHLPSLAKLASMILTGRDDGVAIQFDNGGLGCIEVDNLPANSGKLLFYLTAGQLAAVR